MKAMEGRRELLRMARRGAFRDMVISVIGIMLIVAAFYLGGMLH